MTKLNQVKTLSQIDSTDLSDTVDQVSSTPNIDLVELSKIHTTKSSMIRYLYSIGYKRGKIAKELSSLYGKEMRYQHVRNVLITPLKTQ